MWVFTLFNSSLISPPTAVMGPDEQLLLQVWDESVGCEREGRDNSESQDEDVDDDDEDYFIGSWVFNVDELRQPCSQKHVITLNHELYDQDHLNQMCNEAFSEMDVVMPETIMTVKVRETISDVNVFARYNSKTVTSKVGR